MFNFQVVKMSGLDLQQSLQNEIKSKNKLQEELQKTRTAYIHTKSRMSEAEEQVFFFAICTNIYFLFSFQENLIYF